MPHFLRVRFARTLGLAMMTFGLLGVSFAPAGFFTVKANDAKLQAFPSTQAAAQWLFTSVPLDGARFTNSFKNQFPIAQVDSLISQSLARYGAFVRIDTPHASPAASPSRGGEFLVILEKGRIPLSVTLSAEGLIAGLFLKPARVAPLGTDRIPEELEKFPGKTSAFVDVDGKAIMGVRESLPLGVGSSFKVVVLEALQKRVNEGRARWDEVVRLTEQDKSLPSGKLHDWPNGSALTLETLASLMISESDNTATDTLIHFLGTNALEKMSPRNTPFLTTRQLFVLKAKSNIALLERYRASTNVKQRRSLLVDADAFPRPGPDGFGTDVRALDLEWFLTTRELCHALRRTAALELTRINPGLAVREDWNEVAYKGGSEGGVLNLTTHVVAKSGKSACVSLTWNNDTLLDEAHLIDLNAAILEGLKDRLSIGD